MRPQFQAGCNLGPPERREAARDARPLPDHVPFAVAVQFCSQRKKQAGCVGSAPFRVKSRNLSMECGSDGGKIGAMIEGTIPSCSLNGRSTDSPLHGRSTSRSVNDSQPIWTVTWAYRTIGKHRPVLARESQQSGVPRLSSNDGQPMTYHAVEEKS